VLRDLSLLKPNLINMSVHSATCSCPVELYKLWYILADFLPNWNFRGVFSTVHAVLYARQALAHILTINVPLFKNLRDIIEGPWLQKDIKLPMSRCLRKFGT
jgi:hypothetical protein